MCSCSLESEVFRMTSAQCYDGAPVQHSKLAAVAKGESALGAALHTLKPSCKVSLREAWLRKGDLGYAMVTFRSTRLLSAGAVASLR